MEARKSQSEGSIREDTEKKKMFPELIFKSNIIEVHKELLEAEEVMNKFYEKTGKYNQVHVIILKGKIIKLFKMVKEMIKKSSKMDSAHERVYSELWRFSVHEVEVNDVKTLMRFIDFLIYYLDELNLTNLLMSAGRGFISKMNDEY